MHHDRPATPSTDTQQPMPPLAADADALSLAERGRRSVLARAVAGLVAMTLWLGPMQVTLQQAQQAAGVLAAGAVELQAPAVHAGAVRQSLLRWAVAHLPVMLRFGPAQAYAAPITDPSAPVRFTPTITSTTGPGAPQGGVPVVGITTPNAQGISLNQYRAFVVDPIGLILNNSATGGGSFLGGQVGANANLAASGPASLIINQVTSQSPAQINGTVEVFGAPAGLVIAAPGGVYTSGAGFTNTTQVTLTTGTPQFLTAGGAPTSFDTAAAAGFLVQGGRVQIANPAPGNANASGIEGTVGNISLIAESIGIDAALHAGNQINLVAGRQLVTPDAGGFATSAAGANNAATNSSATGGLAIDATAFGAMNAGQIKIVSTAAGLGVRADGSLAASSGNLTLDSAGNLKVGNTYAKQQAALTAAGAVAASGNGLGEAGYSIKAGTDATLGGTLESGRALSVAAGGSITGAGGAKAQDAVTLAAGGSVDIGGVVNGAQVAVQAAGNDGRGDIRLRGDVTSPGQIQLLAARDTTIDGNAISASDLNLSTRRNLTINGAAGSTSGNVALTGVTGSVTTAGNVVSPGMLTVNAGTDVNLGGEVLSAKSATVVAGSGSIATTGQIGSNEDLTLVAAQNVTVGGQAQSAGNTAITAAAGSVAIDGALTSDKDVTVTAGRDAVVSGNLGSGGAVALTATAGSATVNGTLGSVGNASLAAGQDIHLAGSVLAGGNLAANAGRTLNAGQLTWVAGNATLRGKDISIGSAPGQVNAVSGTLDAAATRNLTLTGDTTAGNASLAGQAVANGGATIATQQLTVQGGALSNTGTLAGNQLTLAADSLVNRGTIGGQNVTATLAGGLDNAQGLIAGTQNLAVTAGALTANQGGTLFAGDLSGQNPAIGDLTFSVTGGNGSFNNAAGQLLAGNNLTLNTPSQVFDPSAAANGTLNANGTLTLAALAINNTGTWNVPGGRVVLNASQGITNTGTIQKAGDLSLATGGTLANSGQIIGGGNLSLSAGSLGNTGTVHANGDLALNGDITNAGTVESLGNIAITGSNYDNRGGTTQANGDLKIDIGGTVNNLGSVLGANGNLHIAAGAVINDRAGPVDAGSATSKASNPGLLDTVVIGSYVPWLPGGSCDSCPGFIPGTPTEVTLGNVMRNPDGSVRLVLGRENTTSGDGFAQVYLWHFIPTSAWGGTMPPDYQNATVRDIAAPTVDRTTIRQTDGAAGQIISGGNLDITAASLSNKGGVVSAGRDVTLNLGSLDNGRSATLVNSVTDTVNQVDLSAFMARLAALTTELVSPTMPGPLVYGVPPVISDCDTCPGPPPWSPVVLGQTGSGAQPALPSQSTVSYQLGKAGQIVAGGNLGLTGTGDLTNSGDLAAAGKIAIATPGTFTNQGLHDSQVITTPGCVPGAASCPGDSYQRVETLAWQQTPSTVAAGQTLTIDAANIQNLSGTLAAQGDVKLTAGSSVTNQAGAIQSLNGDVSITAPTLVNKTLDPVQLHKSYGSSNPAYAGGCNPGGSYGNSQCAATEDTAAGPAAVISAARDVQINGGTLTNKGALITGGRDVTVSASGAIDNSSLPLNADWVGRWQEDRSGGDRWHDTGGRATLGSLESGIQAGRVLSVTAGGQVLNTGNLMGSTVDLTGAALVNGYTSPNQPTPPSTGAQQVISLGPVAAPAGAVPAATPVSDPTRPWQFNPVIVAAPTAPDVGGKQTIDWHFNANLGGNPVSGPSVNTDRAQYLNNSAATAVLAGVTPDSLLAQLPAELRPGNVNFYYDPYTEGQKLQQAALQQTGQASFINGLAWDSQNQLSVTDQEKLVLYRNAADYAKEHSIALGTALTPEQVSALDAPMLWYVQQAVPDPSCNSLASIACPTVNALVPQVYLPEGYAQALTKPTGGSIAGDNIKLDIEGQLRNTGTVTATDTLQVKAGSIEIGPNVVDIGTSAYKVQGGWNEITGTVVQPGGFMSAMHMDIETERIHAVNDAFLIRNADGTVDEAATLALVNQLKANLGLNYTEDTVSDDIHTRFIKEKKGFGVLGQIVALAAAVAISIVTAGTGTAIVGAAYSAAMGATAAAGAAFAAAGIGAAMSLAVTGLVAGTLSSMASQLILNGSLDIGAALKAGVVSGATAGLTKGVTAGLDLGGAGLSSIGENISLGNWGAIQANFGSYIASSVVRSAISAGVNTIAYGGSFGQAFAGGLVRDAAAGVANAIGGGLPGIGSDKATAETILANAAGHALLGCAAASLTGGDCAGGAVGGAASAIVAPLIRDVVYADSPVLNYSDDKIRQALTVGLATLIGGVAGELLGTDATSAALAAQNESLNNATSTGPARGIANRENARLTKLCEPDCTVDDFRRIDKQVREVEAAAMLARMNNLTPEQTLKLADTLSNLLPYYGSAAMLYQAVTGQTLSGQSLDTADRWLSGILGAIPVGAVAYSKISTFIATKGTLASDAIVTAGGTANAATAPKLADDLASKMAKPVVSDAKLGGLIDDLYRDGAKIGTGSTADAVRYETQTGSPIGGVFHTQKAQDYSIALQKWLDSSPNASFGDRSAAQNVLRDLQNALGGK
ncbi:two-partner secretion domain-containing protein [Cupriavidus basilensis]|uniref:two-partner secretion domain-containing protein n=1 Tax=Cupriavidus basilensis TaxID=68895 RepID=UPI001E5F6CD8|nr:filamentous hemagglutinin N-terminal domain-containing protein [Cupriavidus basilensis]